MNAPRLSMRGVVKTYGGTRALSGVDLDVCAGEIHALVGENGAGKSTLMKILGGVIHADAGTIAIDGRDAVVREPADAARAGIAIVHQELRLVPELTVAENLVLGHEPVRARWPRLVDGAALERAARAALEQLGETGLDPRRRVAELGIAERQLVEIARALGRKARVLALDEPTASLTSPEIERLFASLQRLAADGVAIIYISHRLDEVFRIARRVTVLRDGAVVHHGAVADLTRAGLIQRMVGRELEHEYPWEPRAAGDELLRVLGLEAPGVRGASFTLRAGEVLGISGLVGAGRSELALALFGATRRTGGRVWLAGREIDPRSPRDAIDLGLALLTEDRNRLGLVEALNVRENVTLAALRRFSKGPFVRRGPEREAARELADRLALAPRDVEVPVTQLSGGNRQKVVLARWLLARARVLIFDEPTAGVDVGAKRELYLVLASLAAAGTGVIVISSDLPEVLGISDRVLVMAGGRIAGELSREDATEERVMALAVPAGTRR